MEKLTLEAKIRKIQGKQSKQLRLKGEIPAVVYGHGLESRSLVVDYRIFEKLLKKAGESSLVDLSVEGQEPVKVLIQEVQRDPLKETIVHVDFRQVRMTEKLEADIEFNFTGESPAVKGLGAIMVRNMDKITARCLPQYLVPFIEVDLSGLKNFGDNIKVKDIKTPEGMEFLANPNDLVVSVTEPISEEELKELEAKPVEDVGAVKAETEEKKAEKEATEGAVAEPKEKGKEKEKAKE